MACSKMHDSQVNFKNSLWSHSEIERIERRVLNSVIVTSRHFYVYSITALRSMRGGFIFRNRGPSLKLHRCHLNAFTGHITALKSHVGPKKI